jgi:serine/threonine protein kinase
MIGLFALNLMQLDNLSIVDWFRLQIIVMPQLTHPTMLSYLAFEAPDDFESGAEGLLAMEFMPNGSLDDINHRFYNMEHPPEWDATARSKAVLGIVAGMTYAHSLGITHCDLCPQKILVDENFEVRIASFGKMPWDLRSAEMPPVCYTLAPTSVSGR